MPAFAGMTAKHVHGWSDMRLHRGNDGKQGHSRQRTKIGAFGKGLQRPWIPAFAGMTGS
jgi:hypothetical protein